MTRDDASRRRNGAPDGERAVSLPAERKAFAVLKSWLLELFDEFRLDEKTKRRLLIASDEIFTNIASYGFPNGEGRVDVAVEYRPEREIAIVFSDDGVPYNPLDAAAPDVSSPLSERPIGGLGVFLAKKTTDALEYRRDGRRNVLTLRKFLSAGTSNAGDSP